MTLNSVAMIIAPNLFLIGSSPLIGISGARRAPKRLKELLEVSTAAGISSVIRLVIYYQELLWQVAKSVIHQSFCCAAGVAMFSVTYCKSVVSLIFGTKVIL